LNSDEVSDWLIAQAKSVYKARESLLPKETMTGFERFVILRTIDDKWKDHLYGMDQLREGINLRAYGQKNPLLEYKTEGFKMFQEMLTDLNTVTIQRLFRTQIQGMEREPTINKPRVRNIKTSHEATNGMGFTGSENQNKKNQPQQVRTPIQTEQKQGRNEKVTVRSPNGEEIEIKFKKLKTYINKGYSQV